jgi:hypothetical protein
MELIALPVEADMVEVLPRLSWWTYLIAEICLLTASFIKVGRG